ncbi:MAG: ATP synthase F0 subunit B [Desulfobacteraceae bacterium]|nr:ATP synthase F0 subunit B [Desulfobacteraceae bacterium]MBC2720162.1 ATP synthase F0 subunit B [Desulfobacteraceae bacterium]
MISLDGSLFIQIINFLFLIWVLNVVLYKPIRNILIQRKEKITGLEQNIDACNSDIKGKDDAFTSGLKEARGKGMGEKDALIQVAIDEEKMIIEKINQKAQADLVEVREKVAKEAESVRVSLKKELDEIAIAISHKILGRAF